MELTKSGLILLCSLVLLVSSTKDDPLLTYDTLYTSGVNSYFKERWFECSESLKNALEDFEFYRDGLVNCRLHCQDKSRKSMNLRGSNLELTFFDVALKRSDCLRRCKEKIFKNRPDAIAPQVQKDFDDLVPYDYLQICAYKAGQTQLAVSAAFTFLLAHPDHEAMQSNMKFYQDLADFDESKLVNMERKLHEERFGAGVTSYMREDWAEVILHIEEALTLFYQEVHRCRVSCEGPYDHQSLPAFYSAIADHWLHVVQCQAACPDTVSRIDHKPHPSLLSDMYHYLQFAYYKVGNLEQAASCAGTFLHFHPDDAVMLKNRDYYLKQDHVQPRHFSPRFNALEYKDQQDFMKEQLDFVKDRYKYSSADEDDWPLDEAESDKVAAAPEVIDNHNGAKTTDSPKKIDSYQNTAGITITSTQYANPLLSNASILGPRNEAFLSDLHSYLHSHHLHLVAEAEELEGELRVMADGFLSQQQCEQLMDLASRGGEQGDGYRDKSPHTQYEMFEGLTVSRTAQLVKSRALPTDQARLYLDITESGRRFLEKYYNLQTPLFYHFTHLVCRTSLTGMKQGERSDLSHPVHTDNCYIQPDGTCLRESPAYAQRDFSGIIYLNDAFEGGDFFFAHKNHSVQKSVRPRCGRMVGFESSDFHGVLPVTSGRRCAVAVWYTLDARHQETGHAQAYTQLDTLDGKHRKVRSQALDELMKENQYELVMTETELNGPQRFTVDRMTTTEQCGSLVKLYKAAVASDMIRGHDPLSVDTAAQLAVQSVVSVQSVMLLLDVSEAVTKLIKSYFDLSDPLYIDSSQLNCRTADQDKKNEVVQPVVSDNCVIQPDKTCLKLPPAATHRHYSALLYLSDGFQGGDFFFSHHNFSIQSSLHPHCGRMLAFGSGNYHGEKSVDRGELCAVKLWFTLDADHRGTTHSSARQTLNRVRARGPDITLHDSGEL